jgi:hypothetical protein
VKPPHRALVAYFLYFTVSVQPKAERAHCKHAISHLSHLEKGKSPPGCLVLVFRDPRHQLASLLLLAGLASTFFSWYVVDVGESINNVTEQSSVFPGEVAFNKRPRDRRPVKRPVASEPLPLGVKRGHYVDFSRDQRPPPWFSDTIGDKERRASFW